MAAADYYNASAAHAAPQHSSYQQSPYQQSPYQQPQYQQSPYQQSPHQQPQELYGSPVPPNPLSSRPPPSQQTPPPPYHHIQQQDNRPTVHFAPSPSPSQQHRPSSSRPSFSQPSSSDQGQLLKPPAHYSPQAQHGSPATSSPSLPAAPHMRPYMNGNQSQYALNGGYSSDPEQKRRRRRRHEHHERDERDTRDTRDDRPRKNRSRSSNADGFLGAAGGGIIGDMIFPGLGTVGGAVAGWIGGRDYGKHRKHKEDKLHREQEDWERRFGKRSGSGERRDDRGRHHGRRSSSRDSH